MKLKPISSLFDLQSLGRKDAAYRDLAIRAAENLGGMVKDFDSAMRWLNISADETDEDGVVAEVNFCI